jgi:hypothetical protein
MCGLCRTILRDELEKKAPEEQDAQNYQDGDDDDLDETHGRFLMKKNLTA